MSRKYSDVLGADMESVVKVKIILAVKRYFRQKLGSKAKMIDYSNPRDFL